MPLSQAQIQAAQAAQHAAAHEHAQQVRVVAGPGTGKSFAIEERVRWLLSQEVLSTGIYAVSFTRASARDLSQRIHDHCTNNGYPQASKISVTTLHSLALRTLRHAGLLQQYPAEPQVLDDWELENIFDAEFGHKSGITQKSRRDQIRRDHEAFWSTGNWEPPNYVLPEPPISAAEREAFRAFHKPRAQCYSCVLPGEIVRQCVEQMEAGTLNAVKLLRLEHLIVDEFQDLNPMDLRFVDKIAAQGAHVFVAGDDDQSIYSFRFASPAGIQDFIGKYPDCGTHTLRACFRCTPKVLDAGKTLISANPQPNRIEKNLNSLYEGAEPPLAGVVHRWQFHNGITEARAIAESCRDLVANGINPRDVLVLVSNRRLLLPTLKQEFERVQVAHELPHTEGFLDSQAGRLVQAIVRIVCNNSDYVAHRVVLGIRPGVGVNTCAKVADAVIENNLNYLSLFYRQLPGGVFTGRPLNALERAREICSRILDWSKSDTINQRREDIADVVKGIFEDAEAGSWWEYSEGLPADMTLEELRDYLWADSHEQQAALREAVLTRLNLPIPDVDVSPPSVRIMTMHGVKGLSGKVVFIPGLEEKILPGSKQMLYPGLVLESARLLYVSITRTKVACIVSYAKNRIVYGKFEARTPSRFVTGLAGRFSFRSCGLSHAETRHIINEVNNL